MMSGHTGSQAEAQVQEKAASARGARVGLWKWKAMPVQWGLVGQGRVTVAVGGRAWACSRQESVVALVACRKGGA